ncbi:S8 family serine peptidase [Streptomyces sp. 3211]|uniref:S8 family serine peptidase n=1 Tax=Streptomyces sp. 3211 TaxID=1964449 RepID=UPI00133169D5|nr:S8 family serine peptidase [Streptomyces sp. 3211]
MTHPTKPDDPAAAYWKMRHSPPHRKKIMHLRDSKRGARKAALALAIMCAVTASPLSSPAFSATPSPGDFRVATENGVENQYLVTLKTQPESLEDRKNIADDIARQYNGKVRFVFESAMNGFSVSMSEADARRLAENTVVDYVEQDVEITEEYAPAIEGAKPQAVETEASWNMDRIDQRKRPLDGKFNANNPTGDGSGAGTRIYVTDSGINPHRTFGNRLKFGTDVTSDPSRGYAPGEDCRYHGTASASVAAGAAYTKDSGDVNHGYGTARGADIVNVKWFNCDGNTTGDQMIRGLDWIVNDPNRIPHKAVVSMSSLVTDLPGFSNAITQLTNSGTSVVIAAHNFGNNVCDEDSSPVYRRPDVIVVGATNEADTRATFENGGSSNYGACVAMWAPGVNVPAASNDSVDGSMNYGGTSASTPAVAGAAAILQARGYSSAAAVKARLQQEASESTLVGMPNSPSYLLHVGGTM